MPELRLGANENMADVRLGIGQVEEVRLGTRLIWRNNVAPFFGVQVNGRQVSTNGIPFNPQDPPHPDDMNLTLVTLQYTSEFLIQTMNLADEDQHYPITVRIYRGDFGEDENLTPLFERTGLQENQIASFNYRAPQPTANNAANFIYDNQIFSVVATDAEEGISIQYFRATVTDSTDNFVFGSYTNTGGTFNPTTSTSTRRLSSTFNTQCFDQQSTTEVFDRITTTPVASQNQIRTCSVTIVGVQDTPPLNCANAQTTRTIQVTTGSGSSRDVTVSTTSFANPAYIPGATPSNNVGGGTRAASPVVTTGACTGSGGCGIQSNTCPGGTQTVTTTRRTEQTNCAGGGIGVFISGTTTTSQSRCNYPNPTFETQSVTFRECEAGGSNDDLISIRTTQNRSQILWTATVTCADGTMHTLGGAASSAACRATFTGSEPPGTTCSGRVVRQTNCRASNPVVSATCIDR